MSWMGKELDEKQILSQALEDLEKVKDKKDELFHPARLEYLLRSIAGSLLVLAKIVSDVEFKDD